MSDKEDLLADFRKLKSKVTSLKLELSSLSREKGRLYTDRSQIRESFFPLIERIKSSKKDRDKHSGSVHALKTKRTQATAKTSGLGSQLKALREEKDKKIKKLGIRNPAASIAADIERLEFKIETSGMPFEQEKKITKVIKEKKAELEKAGQITNINTKIRGLSRQFEGTRRLSEESHQELKLHASVSQQHHEAMITDSKKAYELKKRIKPLDSRLAEISKKNSSLKSELQPKIVELEKARQQLDKLKAEEAVKKEVEEQARLEAKQKQLEDKMRSGKKLTTKDLISLQKS